MFECFETEIITSQVVQMNWVRCFQSHTAKLCYHHKYFSQRKQECVAMPSLVVARTSVTKKRQNVVIKCRHFRQHGNMVRRRFS